jgi:hypothetical protein
MTWLVGTPDCAGWPILPLMTVGFLVAACIPIGPNSVKSDQVDYADEIPPEDVATGRTYATFAADEIDLKRVRIRARVGIFPPILQDSYVTTYYRGRWFWIEDTDFRSKQVFSFVIQLLQLAQTTTAPSLPVVTIPSG